MGALKNLNIAGSGQASKDQYETPYGAGPSPPGPSPAAPLQQQHPPHAAGGGGGGQWNYGAAPPAPLQTHHHHHQGGYNNNSAQQVVQQVTAHPLPSRPPFAQERGEREKVNKDKEKSKDGKDGKGGFKFKSLFKSSRKGSSSPVEDPLAAARRGFGAEPGPGGYQVGGGGYYQDQQQQPQQLPPPPPPPPYGGGRGLGWEQQPSYNNHLDGIGSSSHDSRRSGRAASFDQGPPGGGYGPGGFGRPLPQPQPDYAAAAAGQGGGIRHGRGASFGGRPSTAADSAVRPPHTTTPTTYFEEQEPPGDLLCPISGLLMAEPVIVPSGATYEKRCFEAWYNSGQRYCLHSNIVLESPSFFPNIGVAKRVAAWCQHNGRRLPDPPSAELAGNYVRRVLEAGRQSSSPSETPEYATAAAPSVGGGGARGGPPLRSREQQQQVYVAPVVVSGGGGRGGPHSGDAYFGGGPGGHHEYAAASGVGHGGARGGSDPYLGGTVPLQQQQQQPGQYAASVVDQAGGRRPPAAHVRRNSSSSSSDDEESTVVTAPARGSPDQQEYGVGVPGQPPKYDAAAAFSGQGALDSLGGDTYLGEEQEEQQDEQEYVDKEEHHQEYVDEHEKYVAPSSYDEEEEEEVEPQHGYGVPMDHPGAYDPPPPSSFHEEEELSSVPPTPTGPTPAAGPPAGARDPRGKVYPPGRAPVRRQEYVVPPVGPAHVRRHSSSSSSDEEESRVVGAAGEPPEYAFRPPPPAPLKVDPAQGKAFAAGLEFSPPADMRDLYAHSDPYQVPHQAQSPYEASHVSEVNGDVTAEVPPQPASTFHDAYAAAGGGGGAESHHEFQAHMYYGGGGEYGTSEDPGSSHAYYGGETHSSAAVPEDNAHDDELEAHAYYQGGDAYGVSEEDHGSHAYLRGEAESSATVPEEHAAAGGDSQEEDGGFKVSLTLKVPDLSGGRRPPPPGPSNNETGGGVFGPPGLRPPHFSADFEDDDRESISSGDTPRASEEPRSGPHFGPSSWDAAGPATTHGVEQQQTAGPPTTTSEPDARISDFARLQITRNQYGVPPPSEAVPSGPPSGGPFSDPQQTGRGQQYGPPTPAEERPHSGSLSSRDSHPFSGPPHLSGGPHSGSSSTSSGPPSGSFPAVAHRREESDPVGRAAPRFNYSSSWMHSAGGSHQGGPSDPPGGHHTLPLPLNTVPSTYSGTQSPWRQETSAAEPFADVVQKLYSRNPKEQEEGAAEIRLLTRDSPEKRIALCSGGDLSDRVLTGLMELLPSRHPGVQVNAVAAIMNLSLEKENKLKIARAGVIPHLIDLLQRGVGEAQEIAAGAMFSLSLNDENKMAVGVLGGIPHLVQILRAGRPGARRDAAMALYHLSFVQMNRSKLVRAGGVNILMQIAQENQSDLVSRALLILSHLALIQEGRAALSETSNIATLVSLLRPGPPVDGGGGASGGDGSAEGWAEVQEHAAAALFQLSNHNMRFRSQVMQAGAEDLLVALTMTGTQRARTKASALLRIMRDTPGHDAAGRQPAYPVRGGRFSVRDQDRDQNSALF